MVGTAVVCAAVLHGAVEDSAQLVAETLCRDSLARRVADGTTVHPEIHTALDVVAAYGDRVRALVLEVTNLPGGTESYLDKVVRIAGDRDAALIKLSDMVDNAGSLPHQVGHVNDEFITKRADKYRPALDVLIAALSPADLGPVPPRQPFTANASRTHSTDSESSAPSRGQARSETHAFGSAPVHIGAVGGGRASVPPRTVSDTELDHFSRKGTSMTHIPTTESDTRTAGHQSNPEGVLELFFAQKLNYADAKAIATAANLAEFLDTWGLELAPSKYIEELEGRAGSLAERSAMPRGLWTITNADRPQFNAEPLADDQ